MQGRKIISLEEPYEFDVKTYAASVHLASKHTVNYFFTQYNFPQIILVIEIVITYTSSLILMVPWQLQCVW